MTSLVTLAGAPAAQAQAMESRVGVVRATSPSAPDELSAAVDAALLRDLEEIAGIADPVVSPVDLAEIQLGVGCADDAPACLESIARAAGVNALLVRSLTAEHGSIMRLELRYFDSTSSDEPRVVSTEVPAEASGQLIGAVPGLIRELFGIPEIATPAEPTTDSAAKGDPRHALQTATSAETDGVSLVPWALLGGGAAALTIGMIVGANASEDFRAWKRRPIGTREQADQANDDFDDLEARAITADVAMVTGAIVMGLGVTLLVLDLGDDETGGTGRATLALEPRAGGAMLRLQSTFHEVW